MANDVQGYRMVRPLTHEELELLALTSGVSVSLAALAFVCGGGGFSRGGKDPFAWTTQCSVECPAFAPLVGVGDVLGRKS
jgi:hypothetical protein